MSITTNIDWPQLLKCTLLQDGYSLSPVSPLLRTDLNSGRARQRRKYLSTPMEVNLNFMFTPGQYMLFEGFYHYQLNDGVAWFNMPLILSTGDDNYVTRFKDIYTEADVQSGVSCWKLSATLEVWVRPVIDPDWSEILPDYLAGADIFDVAMNREWPLNVDN